MSHGEVKKPAEKKSKAEQLASDLLVGGTIGAISKTIMAPVERVKLLMQTQDSNPAVLRGEVQRYTSIGNCFSRVYSEQGTAAFWRGNLVNCLRYAPQQGSALAFNDMINNMFPIYNSNTDFWKSFGSKLFSGGLAGAIANTICYPFDFARTRLASDLKSGKPQFKGISDCIVTTVKKPGYHWSLHRVDGYLYGRLRLQSWTTRLLQANPRLESLPKGQRNSRSCLLFLSRHCRTYNRHAVQLSV